MGVGKFERKMVPLLLLFEISGRWRGVASNDGLYIVA